MYNRFSHMRTLRFIGQNRMADTPIGFSPPPWTQKCANA